MITKTIWVRVDRAICECVCDNCQKEFIRTRAKTIRSNKHFCSLKCRDLYKKANPEYQVIANQKRSEALKGSKSYLWKNGKRKYTSYVALYKHNHPFSNKAGYIMEHRLVMEKIIGRYLRPEERVHHINEIKYDNRPENLMLFSTDAEHQRYHKKIRLGLI